MNDRQGLEAIVAVVCKYLPPDGISREDAMREIIGLVDPLPEQTEPLRLSPMYEYGHIHDAPQPKQDSISTNDHLCAMLRQVHDVLACTALPMKREWVGLTDDEVFEFLSCGVNGREDINNIEEALRKKNERN